MILSICQGILALVNAASPLGVDIHFMNRQGLMNVTDISQVQPLFSRPPGGGTPMIGSISRMYRQYADVQV